jgi:lipoyl(octanoyl) transferase
MICHVEDRGVMEYAAALNLQRSDVEQRKAGVIPDTLLLLEHPHVFTLGRNASGENLLLPEAAIRSRGAQIYNIDRGGDVTYHGPGQLVGYPIFDLTRHRRDISWFMRNLEEVFIRLAAGMGIAAGRVPGATGVWVGNDKLVAMGIHVSRWVTSHGFALNVSTDLGYFDWIIPCGLRGKGVTSLEKLLRHPVSMATAKSGVVSAFGEVFQMEMKLSGVAALSHDSKTDQSAASADVLLPAS